MPHDCKVAVYACCCYAKIVPDGYVIAKLGFSNVFNRLHRDTMMELIQLHAPKILHFAANMILN